MGVLLAVFLRGLADELTAHTGLSRGWSLAAVLVGLTGVAAGGAWVLSGDIAAQIDQLAQDLPRALRSLSETVQRHEWGRLLLSLTPEMLGSERALAQAPGIVSRTFGTTLGVLTNLVIVAFVGLYVAAESDLYARGILRLVPPASRRRAAEVLGALRHTLQWWLIGKAVVMALVGLLTFVGLWLLGVPLALTLGLLAGLFDFIPYVGPVLGFLPAILLALTQDTTLALWVGGLYLLVQSVESYLFTPLVQRRAVTLAPALTIVCQVVLAVLFGPLGLLLATPLTAVAVVLVKLIYVEGVLGDRMEVQGARADDVAA
jgi:predicted PurR-regulated permease PerM